MPEFFIQEQPAGHLTRTIVKDEQNRSLFLLVGRWGNKGDALSLYAMDGQLVASVKQSTLALAPRFELYQNFEFVGALKKFFYLYADFYYIPQLHWHVTGNIYEHRYNIHKGTQTIMKMDKTMLLSGNYYCLNVTNEADAPVCICIAAVLDYWLYNKKKKDQRKTSLRWKLC